MSEYAALVKELRCGGMDCGYCMQTTQTGTDCVRRKAANVIEELSKRADELGEELTAAMELVHKRNEKIGELWTQLHVEGRSLIDEQSAATTDKDRGKGKWIMSKEFKGYAMCSCCKDAFVDPEWIAKDGKWNYCQNCGARMEATP